MPQGCLSMVAPIISSMCGHVPKTGTFKCMDVGIGFGFYGAAIRQWFDGGRPKSQWKTSILGIEGFAKYKNPCWDCYSHVHVTTIQEYLNSNYSNPDSFHVILLNDCIEHFTKEEGLNLIPQLIDKLEIGGALFISTPGVWIEQGAAYGNILETHRSLWTEADFEALGMECLQDSTITRWGHIMLLYKFTKRHL